MITLQPYVDLSPHHQGERLKAIKNELGRGDERGMLSSIAGPDPD